MAKGYVPTNNLVLIYNESTGAMIGQMNAGTGVDLTNNVLLTGDLLFISSATATYAFNETTLAEVWSANDGGTLSWENGTLLISNSSSVDAFVAVPEPSTWSCRCWEWLELSLIRSAGDVVPVRQAAIRHWPRQSDG